MFNETIDRYKKKYTYSFWLIELVRDKTVFGRSPDCDVQLADFLEQDKLSEISNTHFSIIKINCSDPYSPAFLEVNLSTINNQQVD